jgi:hypothetical protein
MSKIILYLTLDFGLWTLDFFYFTSLRGSFPSIIAV